MIHKPLVLIAAFALGAYGCPDPSERNGKPQELCRKAYDKCTLPSGVLGVCDVTDPPAGQTQPGLVCRAQH